MKTIFLLEKHCEPRMFFDASIPSFSLCGARNWTQHLTQAEAGIFMVSCMPCLSAFSYEM